MRKEETYGWLMSNFKFATVDGREVVGTRIEMQNRRPVLSWDIIQLKKTKNSATVDEWWAQDGVKI